MRESELVTRLQRMYSQPVPASCKMTMMNITKWRSNRKTKATLYDLLAKHFVRFHAR